MTKHMLKVLFSSLLLFTVLFTFGCSDSAKGGGKNASGRTYGISSEYDMESVEMEMPAMAMAAPQAVRKTSAMPVPSPSIEPMANGMIMDETGAVVEEETERKLVKTGSLSFEVDNLETTDTLVAEWAEKYGGYVFSSGSNPTNAWYTVKIPSTNFDDAMNAVGNIGAVKSRSVSTEDVSDSYYDLKTRLETRKIMRDRLSEYLQRAENIDNLLKIESELNSVISDIEYMEGSMKRLNGRIDYSTININASLPFRTDNDGSFQWPDFDDSTRQFFSSVVDFFSEFIGILLYLIICGIPTIAVIILLYWLLFGKLGILIRIFKKVSRPRTPKALKPAKEPKEEK